MEPYDDPEIGPDDLLIRRINLEQHVIWDDNHSCYRVSSKAFSPSSESNGGMSVDIEQFIIQANIDPHQYVTNPTFIGSVAFTTNEARRLQLLVGCDPIPNNPYHGEVWGNRRPNKFSKPQKKGLAAISNWYVEIPGVQII